MNTPNKICIEKEYIENNTLPGGVNYGQRSHGNDIEYIRKDYLLDILQFQSNDLHRERFEKLWLLGRDYLREQLIDKINSL